MTLNGRDGFDICGRGQAEKAQEVIAGEGWKKWVTGQGRMTKSSHLLIFHCWSSSAGGPDVSVCLDSSSSGLSSQHNY